MSIAKTNKIILRCMILFNIFNVAYAETFFISPAGSDYNAGNSISEPWKTFEQSFFNMEAGDELILLDGIYSVENETGGIHWDLDRYPNSSQIPSGIDLNKQTIVRALNAGKVIVDIPLYIGRTKRKDSFITVKNITFNGGRLFNSSYITIKDVGFSNQFVVGTVDHHHGNSYNLIEDVWIWAFQQRIIAMNFRANKNVWRRVVVRGDGCNLKKCLGSGNPNVGFTIYDSSDVSVQNVIVVDRILKGGKGYGDFGTAQHTSKKYFLGRNEWLGIISINSEDNGLTFEADHAVLNDYTWVINNALILDSKGGGINLGNQPYNGVISNIVRNSTIILSKSSKKDGIRLAPGQNKSLVFNNIVVNAGRFAINSASNFSHVITHNPKKQHYNQSKCTKSCYQINPLKEIWKNIYSDVAIPTSIPEKSFYKYKGISGDDIGANIMYRYGADGTRFGDKDFNKLTKINLWPWPNEKRLMEEMCSSRYSKMCKPLNPQKNVFPSLTNYIHNYLVNNDLK